MRAKAPALVAAPLRELAVRIPGEPVAQGRPRAFYRPGLGVRVYDPQKSRNWKATAQEHFTRAMEQRAAAAPLIPEAAVELHIMAAFTCPRSNWRKRDPLPRRPKVSRPDAENVAKAVQDAASGVLFTDDAQVCRLTVEKFVGAQGEAPYVEVTVLEII
jgi:Holliday junction resolvase RusA-like endonuclease